MKHLVPVGNVSMLVSVLYPPLPPLIMRPVCGFLTFLFGLSSIENHLGSCLLGSCPRLSLLRNWPSYLWNGNVRFKLETVVNCKVVPWLGCIPHAPIAIVVISRHLHICIACKSQMNIVLANCSRLPLLLPKRNGHKSAVVLILLDFTKPGEHQCCARG